MVVVFKSQCQHLHTQNLLYFAVYLANCHIYIMHYILMKVSIPFQLTLNDCFFWHFKFYQYFVFYAGASRVWLFPTFGATRS